eukprot:NODE_19769_length_828_cov_3.841655.p1 GENE.NODE_19769_length_828_cov_3.841655~~NODE_19769_length_828_cov_3.841655.p1  ORF type:complete len:150 (-),score=45.21 NODE_19769_length_828_cov_3.841655:181-630(-)
MQRVKEANATAAQREQQRDERQRAERQMNQDYLFKQMAEHTYGKRSVVDQKNQQKQAALADANAHVNAERQRYECQRRKNVNHRLELEQQILARRNAPVAVKDQMSAEEIALNSHLLKDAEGTRARVLQEAEARGATAKPPYVPKRLLV